MSASQQSLRHELYELVSGYWKSQALRSVAELRIADRLQAKSKTAAELAAESGVQSGPLYRLLRALASIEIFVEDSAGRFALTPKAELLLDRPGSFHAVALMMGDDHHYRSWGELNHSLQTGKPAFDHVFGKPVFEYFAEHRDKAAVFDAAMTGFHGPETEAMVAAYDFTLIGTLVDIGGGNGSVLATILKRYPKIKGILYDLPNVIDRAQISLAAQGLAERCQTIAGSFFEQVPQGGEAYLMRHILHDWTDEQCLTILRHCRSAMPLHGRLLIIEMLIAPGNEPSVAKWLDLNMLVCPGGLERTEQHYGNLFKQAGFKLTQVVKTTSPVFVLEARPI